MSDCYQAILRDVRVSPRKARLVANLIRRKRVSQAIDELKFLNKKTAPMITKLLQSAVANSMKTSTVDVDRLVVSEIFVDEGVTLKRFLPRAQGRATPLRKRSSHITVRLREV